MDLLVLLHCSLYHDSKPPLVHSYHQGSDLLSVPFQSSNWRLARVNTPLAAFLSLYVHDFGIFRACIASTAGPFLTRFINTLGDCLN